MESLGQVYKCHYPYKSKETARGAKVCTETELLYVLSATQKLNSFIVVVLCSGRPSTTACVCKRVRIWRTWADGKHQIGSGNHRPGTKTIQVFPQTLYCAFSSYVWVVQSSLSILLVLETTPKFGIAARMGPTEHSWGRHKWFPLWQQEHRYSHV